MRVSSFSVQWYTAFSKSWASFVRSIVASAEGAEAKARVPAVGVLRRRRRRAVDAVAAALPGAGAWLSDGAGAGEGPALGAVAVVGGGSSATLSIQEGGDSAASSRWWCLRLLHAALCRSWGEPGPIQLCRDGAAASPWGREPPERDGGAIQVGAEEAASSKAAGRASEGAAPPRPLRGKTVPLSVRSSCGQGWWSEGGLQKICNGDPFGEIHVKSEMDK